MIPYFRIALVSLCGSAALAIAATTGEDAKHQDGMGLTWSTGIVACLVAGAIGFTWSVATVWNKFAARQRKLEFRQTMLERKFQRISGDKFGDAPAWERET
ncbi:MAG: hypothetical protein JSS51_11855 [Planctomycetes bacterium]|nr:hypothetical protein [Planctomycetota bacterium]